MDADEMRLITQHAQIREDIRLAKRNFENLMWALEIIQFEAERRQRSVPIDFMDFALKKKLESLKFRVQPCLTNPDLMIVHW
jgi:hypothetical protein